MNYDVVFIHDDRRMVKQFEGPNPGTAFAKCLKQYPAARLVSAHVYRRAAGGCEMWMDYAPPSTVKVDPLPTENLVQVEMELR